jgi:hypothetical protein
VAPTLTNRLSVFAVLGVAGFILTGCSASEPASAGGETSDTSETTEAPVVEAQTVEEACTTLEEGATELQTSLQENMTALQSDPVAAAAAFQDVVDAFQEKAAEITNEEVKPVADKVETIFVDLNEIMQAAATDPASIDAESFTTSTTDLQTMTTELSEVCGIE